MASSPDNVCKESGDNGLSIYPIVMDSLRTSVVPQSPCNLSDEEDEDDEEEKLDQLAMRSNGLPHNVQIENSTDIVIGPLTQFHGPVTIYQNVQSDLKSVTPPERSKSEIKSNTGKSNLSKEDIPKKLSIIEVWEKTSTKRLLIYSFLVLSILILVVFGIIWSLKVFEKSDMHLKTTPGTRGDDLGVNVPNVDFYTREQWGGEPSHANPTLLTHPVEYVVIAHTASTFCDLYKTCSDKVLNIQQNHNGLYGEDIRYNFLIGGDGGIYIGRGWDVSSRGKNAVVVAFIGDYQSRDSLTPIMLTALKALLAGGVKIQKLSSDYKLVCHNQTTSTISPGANVYKAVSQLPHFDKKLVKLS